MKTRVYVTLKNGVLDPQGKAIHHALEGLGFAGVNDVRAGKLIELDLDPSVSDEDVVVELEFDQLPRTDIVDAGKAEALQRMMDGLALRIEDAVLEGDEDADLHGAAASFRGEAFSRCARKKASSTCQGRKRVTTRS